MPEKEANTVRKVVWEEILPWLILFRTFRVAKRFRMLLLSVAALVLTAGGWAALVTLEQKFCAPTVTAVEGEEGQAPQVPGLTVGEEFLAFQEVIPDRPEVGRFLPKPLIKKEETPPVQQPASSIFQFAPKVRAGYEIIYEVWKQLSLPFVRIFYDDVTIMRFLIAFVGGLWALIVWGWLGGAMTRVAALALAADENIGWREMFGFATKKWLSFFGGPLIPMVPIAFLTGFLGVVGLFLRANWGVLLTGIAWPLWLLCGLGIALLLVGLLFGWPLMWATVSVEGTDGFDAVSRTYSYVFQRPLHYLFYLVVASLFGYLCFVLVANFAGAIIALTDWAVNWGADSSRWLAGTAATSRSVSSVLAEAEASWQLGPLGAMLIQFWRSLVKLLAFAFVYSYFWTAMTGVYLLLRRDVDAVELNEVNLGEEEEWLAEETAPKTEQPSDAQQTEPASTAESTQATPSAEATTQPGEAESQPDQDQQQSEEKSE